MSAPRDISDMDVSSITGNLSRAEKQLCLATFQHFIGKAAEKVYGAEVGERIHMVETSIWGEGSKSTAQVVFEVTVQQDMCNTFNIMHGGCTAYIVDPCSVASVVVLAIKRGIEGAGLSQSMNLIWHKPIQRDTKIRIVSTSMSVQGRFRTVRCEIWDKDILCVSAVHSTVKPYERLGKL